MNDGSNEYPGGGDPNVTTEQTISIDYLNYRATEAVGYFKNPSCLKAFSLRFEAVNFPSWPAITKYFGNTGDSNYSTNPAQHYTPYNIAGNTKQISSDITAVKFCFSGDSGDVEALRLQLANASIVNIRNTYGECAQAPFNIIPGSLIGFKV